MADLLLPAKPIRRRELPKKGNLKFEDAAVQLLSTGLLQSWRHLEGSPLLVRSQNK